MALAAGCILMGSTAGAYEYGEYADETLDVLINDYPGRYRGTASFEGATAWMQQRIGNDAARQSFTWNSDRTAQNVVAKLGGTSGSNIVLGAHFDTYFGRPTLQGLDDNGSGAAVLTEITRNLSGIALENGINVVAFGAEEEGLRGSRAYVASLSESERSSLLGMINLDSLITGDMMYAHAGANSIDNPALTSIREQTFRIAQELGIDLRSNPGLNPEYPAGTGCCSDAESFESLGIPVLFVEATNWDIGELDGYEQTTNPAIPGGATWHTPSLDNEDVLTGAFGAERIQQRLRDYSRLLTRLLLELTNADLLASTSSSGALARAMEDNLRSQHETLTRLHDRHWLGLQIAPLLIGQFSGSVSIEGEYQPEHGFDVDPSQRSKRATAYAIGDYRANDWLTLGGSLSIQRGKDDLERSGEVRNETWQAGLYGLVNNGGPLWAAGELSAGHTRFDTDRSVFIRANGGPVLLNQTLSGDTKAHFWGARILGGYDMPLGQLKTGPQVGLDYMRYHINDFDEDSSRRTAMSFDNQSYDSIQASLGWRIYGNLPMSRSMAIQPYANLAWVEEIGNGREDQLAVASRGDNRVRTAALESVDKHFARAQVGAQWAITPEIGVYAEVNSRLGHTEGSQTGYSLGAQWRF
jgi:uncharacterized protein YhjY with autotransporter beta-barrel domain